MAKLAGAGAFSSRRCLSESGKNDINHVLGSELALLTGVATGLLRVKEDERCGGGGGREVEWYRGVALLEPAGKTDLPPKGPAGEIV